MISCTGLLQEFILNEIIKYRALCFDIYLLLNKIGLL